MKLSLLVASTPTAALYLLNGRKAIKHKAANYPTEGDTALLALLKGLAVIPWHKDVYDLTGSNSWEPGYRLPITIKASPRLIEAGQMLQQLEDPSGLPEETQKLHSLLKKFDVTWRRATKAEERTLVEWEKYAR